MDGYGIMMRSLFENDKLSKVKREIKRNPYKRVRFVRGIQYVQLKILQWNHIAKELEMISIKLIPQAPLNQQV